MVHANKEVFMLMPSHTSAMLTQICDFQVELPEQRQVHFALCFCSVLEQIQTPHINITNEIV